VSHITPSGGLTNRVIGDGGPWRVLVVDDEETIRLALSKFLRSRGYNVQTAESGGAALDLLQRGKYVLMLCDVRMPGIGGVELVPRALGIDPELAIVMLTAVNDAPTAAEVLSAGESDDVIGKMRVSAVLESMPGVGKARAARIMERLEISPTRRVRGLGAKQRTALEREFGASADSS